ncbi:MAG: response regulator [Candidatus Latescibacterota bacterium]|jgi:CheY-like chemotaxis protein/c-di-GMP-binding flagellar brake protein YcgR
MPQQGQPSAQLEIADQIELRFIDPETGEARHYRSSVLDLTPETMAVAMPMDRQIPVLLPEGAVLVVSLWKDFADHRFRTRVLRREAGHLPQLILARPAPGEMTRTPRREYFRVETRIAVHLLLVDREDPPQAAVMLDLSGGGGRLQTTFHLPASAPLLLDFELPFAADKDGLDRIRPMRRVPAQVKTTFTPARTVRGSRARQNVHLAGIEFGDLENVTRNALLRYVAFRQREILHQMQGEARREARPPEPEVEELEQRLRQLEEDLREAGQEVPVVPENPAPPQDAPGTATPSAGIDALFAQTTVPEPKAPVAPHPVAQTLPGVPPTGKTVLLVEDEAALRSVLAEGLMLDGHAVAEAANGLEGLDYALHHPVDVVITDLMMPRMNGWRLLSALREHHREMPVIIITAYMNQEGQEVLASREVAGFLVKPIDLVQMNEMVRSVLSEPEDRPRRILAVDDDDGTRSMVTACLEQAGFEVEAVPGGREALGRVPFFRPDLVVLDVVMPGMDGFEVARRLRGQTGTTQTPIIMLTTRTSAEDVRQAVELKVSGYLVKPFGAAALVDRVRRTLLVPAGG